MTQLLTQSTEETETVGEKLAALLLASERKQAFIALYGDMGVGKTAFVRGFARALGIKAVKSPTYTVVNEYLSGVIPVFHFDMYRIEDEDDLYSIGFDDYISRYGYMVLEWSEKIPDAIPDDAIRVTIEKTDREEARVITVSLNLSI